MEPHVSAGDVVLVVPGTGTPVIGEIIAFPDPLRPERDVLHRVVAIDDRGGLVTRGDANDVDDPWSVSPNDVIGVEVLTVPHLGFVVSAVTSDVGIFLFLVVPALLILISESKVWYRFIRHGRAAFEARSRGRHLPSRRLAESET